MIFEHTYKLFRSATATCRLNKPNGCVSSPTVNCINTSDLTPHLASSSLTHSSLSFSHWFIQLLGNLSLSNVWKKDEFSRLNCRTKISSSRPSLTSVDQGVIDQLWLQFLEDILFLFRPHFWHKNWGNMGSLTSADFMVDFSFTVENYNKFSLIFHQVWSSYFRMNLTSCSGRVLTEDDWLLIWPTLNF